MKLHRFIGNFNLNGKEVAISDTDLLSQWKNVLRLRVGDKLTLSDGRGVDALCSLEELSPYSARLVIIKVGSSVSEPFRPVHLCLAILKKENFELAVQKAVECGASTVTPVISSRTVKLGLNLPRLKKIAKEAAEQSGRGIIPEVTDPTDFESSLKIASPGKIIFLDPTGEPLADPDEITGEGDIFLFVGPEGGWAPEEIVLAKSYGARLLGLGPRILRAETAAAVGTFVAAQIIQG